jgi:hypothetical protein
MNLTPDEILGVVLLIIGYPVIYFAGSALSLYKIRRYLRRHDIEDYRKNKRKWKWFYLNKIGILPWNLLLPYWGVALGLLSAEVFAILYILTDLLVFRILVTIFFCIFVFSLFYQIEIFKRSRNKK